MKTFHKGGVHPNDNKINADAPVETLPVPDSLCLMVSQHLGAPSTPIVQKGDKVRRGQALTENKAFLGSVIHAPVSGTVQSIGTAFDTGHFEQPAIFIKPEGDEAEDFIIDDPTLDREIRLSPAEIIERIKDMGIVGLGGACFPTHIKLTIPKDCKADYLLINGVECEPYLTDDYRLMLDKPDEILVGIQILMKALSVEKALIGIEANKPKAIALLGERAAAYPGIRVEALKMKYPQGAEKQLVKALTGREVPSGKLPINAGCVIQNVATCFAVYEAVQKHKPLTERL
ncbi:MAG: RnfABCDGE type electron transport complex subunit C, partial [Bacteroidales bacterium]|nr:RnfABCDGE type electron transport complex subunit C [Bacteroidales bacterium]